MKPSNVIRTIIRHLKPFRSANYWNNRYRSGGTSGAGSYGRLAYFKADFLNRFVHDNNIATVLEFGCGDGNQLHLARYPKYSGYDVSKSAIGLCNNKFQNDPTKSFALVDDWHGEKAELALSLDVIFHLVEDPVFENYMQHLFAAASNFVIIYSSDCDGTTFPITRHVKHRRFSEWITRNEPSWLLVHHTANPFPYNPAVQGTSFCDFFVYEKSSKSMPHL